MVKPNSETRQKCLSVTENIENASKLYDGVHTSNQEELMDY